MAEAQTRVVVTAVDKASEVIRGITGQFDSLKTKWLGVAAALGATTAVTGLTALVKSSIDAGDKLGDLAARAGIGVKALSDLQVAAKTSNTSIEEVASVLGRMNKNLMGVEAPGSNAAKALQILGIDAKRFQEAKLDERLLMLADAASKADNSTGALTGAMDMLVKGGSALIPMLQNGREGMEEMIRINRALGLSLDEDTAAAMDRVNDTFTIMGMLSQGLGNTIAQRLLPTLDALAKLWLDNATASGGFADVLARAVEYVFKGAVTVVLALTSSLKGLGTILAGIAASVATKSFEPFKQSLRDAEEAGRQANVTLKQLWSDSLPKMTASERQTTSAIIERMRAMAEADRQAKESKKQAKELEQAERERERQLKQSQKALKDYMEEIQRRAEAEAKLEVELQKRAAAEAEAIRQAQLAYLSEVDAVQKRNESMRLSIETTRLARQQNISLAEAVAQVELAKLREHMVEMERQDAAPDYLAALREEIELRKQLLDSMATDRIANMKTAWTQFASDIERALTDALVRGFEGGKSVLRSVGDWIVNYFKTSVARGIAQAITGALGAALSGVASAATGGATVSGVAGGVSGLGGIIGAISSASPFASGVMATLFGGSGIGGSLTAAGSLLTSGSMTGAAAGLGMLAPYAAAAGGLYALIRGIGTGRQRAPAYQQFGTYGGADFGYLAGSPNLALGGAGYFDQFVRGVADAVGAAVKSLGGTAGATSYGLYASVGSEGSGAYMRADVLGAAGNRLLYIDSSASNESLQQRIAEAVPKMILAGLQDADLPKQISDYIRKIDISAATKETVDAAIAAANSAINLSRALQALGPRFDALAMSSVETLNAMAELAGGMDALRGSIEVYYREFYSSVEREQHLRASLTQEIEALGLAMPATREEFRALVEAQAALGEAGAETVTKLISLAGAFASLVPAADETVRAVQQTTDKLTDLVSASTTVAETLTAVPDAANSVADSISSMAGSMTAAAETISQAAQSAFESVNLFGGTGSIGQDAASRVGAMTRWFAANVYERPEYAQLSVADQQRFLRIYEQTAFRGGATDAGDAVSRAAMYAANVQSGFYAGDTRIRIDGRPAQQSAPSADSIIGALRSYIATASPQQPVTNTILAGAGA